MDSNLFKTKSIEQLVGDVEHGGKALRRSLSALDLTLLGIGAIIGTGIFVLTGTAAANQAGPAITMSYLAAGLACAFAALCYAEFASMIPIAGQRLHLRLRHARRARGVDDRLGPDPRIRRRLDDRRDRLERLHAAAPGGIRPRAADRHRRRAAGGHHQPAGRDHRAADHDPARGRRPRVGALQRGDGGDQGRRGAVLPRRRHHLRRAGQLAAVRAVRMAGHHGRRRRRVLRLHRFRRGVDDGGRGQESAARPADRHHRLAGDLHGALPGGGRGADRHRAGDSVPRRSRRRCPGCRWSRRSSRFSSSTRRWRTRWRSSARAGPPASSRPARWPASRPCCSSCS